MATDSLLKKWYTGNYGETANDGRGYVDDNVNQRLLAMELLTEPNCVKYLRGILFSLRDDATAAKLNQPHYVTLFSGSDSDMYISVSSTGLT